MRIDVGEEAADLPKSTPVAGDFNVIQAMAAARATFHSGALAGYRPLDAVRRGYPDLRVVVSWKSSNQKNPG